jgi:hypothetical protein
MLTALGGNERRVACQTRPASSGETAAASCKGGNAAEKDLDIVSSLSAVGIIGWYAYTSALSARLKTNTNNVVVTLFNAVGITSEAGAPIVILHAHTGAPHASLCPST